ncbi:ATP-binding protein [Natranaerobius trueperi]|uniref:histidine kinase n=1 Tax=Natranaerobius trueperi TaxID=759412 RepID=A0A226BZE9_9FIRM|nr:ATP-binding protein [Natranaerobius trueperi]OWZ83500.1 PAS domain-containing sensor histidine kinase [Natranaerobius trueperi]
MFKTVQWKLVVIFLLLMLLAMELISVYLLQSLDQYYLDDYRERMSSEADLIRSLLERHLAEEQDEEYISQLIEEFGKQAQNEITVLDENGRILATSSGEENLPGKVIAEQEITRALSGNRGTDIKLNQSTNVREKSLAIPVERGNQILGAIYLVGSLERVDETLGEVRTILFTGTVFAMIVTVVLGIILSRTITRPVQVVTQTAQAMAQGDFNQRIEVKSDDEIGNLGKMFNYLAYRLDHTLKEISSEKAKVEAILTQMSDGVIAVNRNREIIHINPAAEKMLDLDGEKLINHSAEPIIDKFVTNDEFQNMLEGDNFIRKEKNITTNEKRVLQAQLVPFKAERKQHEGVIIALNDITEQQDLIQMRQEFVANVSHELRTPLTTVKSYIETLLDGAYKDEKVSQNFLDVVYKETNRMVSMVKELMVLSQLDRKEPVIEFNSIDVKEVVYRSVNFIEPIKKDRNINLQVNISSENDDIYIQGDSNKLTQVFTNLLENAIKYSVYGGQVDLELSCVEKAVEIKVKDNGIGIPSKDLPRIFERFYRVEKARSRAQGGTGLGLAIAREIIQAHGGDITVSSQEGKGTEVYLFLPKVQEAHYVGAS